MSLHPANKPATRHIDMRIHFCRQDMFPKHVLRYRDRHEIRFILARHRRGVDTPQGYVHAMCMCMGGMRKDSQLF